MRQNAPRRTVSMGMTSSGLGLGKKRCKPKFVGNFHFGTFRQCLFIPPHFSIKKMSETFIASKLPSTDFCFFSLSPRSVLEGWNNFKRATLEQIFRMQNVTLFPNWGWLLLVFRTHTHQLCFHQAFPISTLSDEMICSKSTQLHLFRKLIHRTWYWKIQSFEKLILCSSACLWQKRLQYTFFQGTSHFCDLWSAREQHPLGTNFFHQTCSLDREKLSWDLEINYRRV